MSALPRAIQKQIKDAEEAHAMAYKKEKPKSEPSEDKKLEVVNEETPQPEETEQKVQPEAAAEPQLEAASEPSAEQPVKPVEDAEYWKKRWEQVDGRLKKDMARARGENSAMREELNSMRQLLAQLNEQKKAEPSVRESPALSDRLLKQQEIEDYGDELISVIHRGAQEAFNPEIAALREEINQLKSQLGGVSQTLHSSQRDNVLDVLTEKVPDWRTLNEDELFLSWLDEVDAFSGEPRQALLDRAFKSGDAARVVAFFKGYLNESAALQPPQKEPAPPPRTPATKLDGMVAPGKPKGAPGGAQKGEKRMWTQKQIADFYQQVNKGEYRNQPDKQVAIERDIVAAGREGRITA